MFIVSGTDFFVRIWLLIGGMARRLLGLLWARDLAWFPLCSVVYSDPVVFEFGAGVYWLFFHFFPVTTGNNMHTFDEIGTDGNTTICIVLLLRRSREGRSIYVCYVLVYPLGGLTWEGDGWGPNEMHGGRGSHDLLETAEEHVQ